MMISPSPPSRRRSRNPSSPTMPTSAMPSSTCRGMSVCRWKWTTTPGSDGISAVYLRGLGRETPMPQAFRKVEGGIVQASAAWHCESQHARPPYSARLFMASTILSSRRANPMAGTSSSPPRALTSPSYRPPPPTVIGPSLAVAGNLEHDAGVVRDSGYEGEIEYDVVERHSTAPAAGRRSDRRPSTGTGSAPCARRISPTIGSVSSGAPRTFERSVTRARAAGQLVGAINALQLSQQSLDDLLGRPSTDGTRHRVGQHIPYELQRNFRSVRPSPPATVSPPVRARKRSISSARATRPSTDVLEVFNSST